MVESVLKRDPLDVVHELQESGPCAIDGRYSPDDWPSSPSSMMEDFDGGTERGFSPTPGSPQTPATEVAASNSPHTTTNSDSSSESDADGGDDSERHPIADYLFDSSPGPSQFMDTTRGLLDHLFSRFQEWRQTPTADQHPETRSDSHISQPPSTQSSPSRSSRQDQQDHQEPDNSGVSEPTGTTDCHPQETDGLQVLFACPFWKQDRTYWKDCFGYKLKRIRDVKQHLRRKHSQLFCCDRCGREFRSADVLIRHSSSFIQCNTRSFRRKWLSETQKEVLAKKSPRAKPDDQWYAMWDLIFPRQLRPDSPYLDESLCNHLSSFRDFLEQRGPDIIQQFGQQGGFGSRSATQSRQLLQQGLSRVYDQWVSRMGQPVSRPQVANSITLFHPGNDSQGQLMDQARVEVGGSDLAIDVPMGARRAGGGDHHDEVGVEDMGEMDIFQFIDFGAHDGSV